MSIETTEIILPDPDIEWVHNNAARLWAEYGKKWIAVKHQSVVGTDDDGSVLIARVAELGVIGALVTQVSLEDVYENHYLIA